MQISLKNVSKSFGSSTLFEIDSLTINEKDKVGIVGRNGSGKTTLLNIISGRDSDYTGEVYVSDRTRTGFLEQSLSVSGDNTIFEEVMLGAERFTKAEEELSRLAGMIDSETDRDELIRLNGEYEQLHLEFERMDGYSYRSRVTGIIKGLGYSEEDFDKIVSTLSGGQKMRVALAKLLASDPEMLILDEPTNYLDTESVQWLERYLSQLSTTILVVSHDRYFLDVFTNRIVEISEGRAFEYTGNYTDYVSKKKIQLNSRMKAWQKQQEEIARQEKVIAKLKQFNREKTVKRARSREKLLDRMELVERPESEQNSRFSFPYVPMISKKALTLEGVDFCYVLDRPLIRDLNLTVTDHDRLGICGQNATGKTTLLKLMTGHLSPDYGLIRENPRTRMLYFSQEHAELDESLTILEYFRRETGEDDLQIRNLLARLLFRGDDINKLIGSLSGGEKSKLAFAMLMFRPSNILILDEPTNHLDIETKEMLEDALLGYEGAVVAVSHDRYFLNKICRRILYFSGDDIRTYLGNYDEAMEKISESRAETAVSEKKETARKKQSRGLSNNKINSYRNRLEEIERIIESLEEERDILQEKMGEPGFASDISKLESCSVRLEEIRETIEKIEEEWLEIQDILEENDS